MEFSCFLMSGDGMMVAIRSDENQNVGFSWFAEIISQVSHCPVFVADDVHETAIGQIQIEPLKCRLKQIFK